MRLLTAITLASLITLGLSACGQKGPLYMPQPTEQASETKP